MQQRAVLSDRGRDETVVDLGKGMRKVRLPEWSSVKGAWEGFGSGMTV